MPLYELKIALRHSNFARKTLAGYLECSSDHNCVQELSLSLLQYFSFIAWNLYSHLCIIYPHVSKSNNSSLGLPVSGSSDASLMQLKNLAEITPDPDLGWLKYLLGPIEKCPFRIGQSYLLKHWRGQI